MNILITGQSSYITTRLKIWLENYPKQYNVDTISLKTDEWKLVDFSKYDSVLHFAGIAHQKESKKTREEYFKVNSKLTLDVAVKAKASKVTHFIFMSSMSVYGEEGTIGADTTLNIKTKCNPNSFYGESKLDAENEITTLNDVNFSVSIIRAPMIYGPNCPGNYAKLRTLVLKFKIFPLLENKRSMIYIDNLSEFIRILLEKKTSGVFLPQNNEWVSTKELVFLLAHVHQNKIIFSHTLAIIVKKLDKKIKVFNKLFGNLTYEKEKYDDEFNYNVVDFENSIILTEKQWGVSNG
ncbi:NAD-dependent epimerase/dehydratase family protein [Paenibacillus tengchongensis]|uniref:NAD-dependent epimerase/dehydratase family protein n=1 Tax=Paenibacillus tengchongensis TaxID=2608684 RepID=UPI00124C8887|nr:NAD-dependent epimerase/dehydratase family protein [Paenibacillus tengchongensis]